MRFIRKEHIITTIFNKELLDNKTIRTVFENLKSHNVSFSMTMKKISPYQNDYFNLNFEEVRIKVVHDNDTLDLFAVKKGVRKVMKNVSFSDIIEVNTITKKHKIIDVDDDLTRFDILDYRKDDE